LILLESSIHCDKFLTLPLFSLHHNSPAKLSDQIYVLLILNKNKTMH
jgi:hypothetical protein